MCVLIISRDFDLVVCVPIYEILLSLDEPIHTTHTTQHTHNKMHTHIHNRLEKKESNHYLVFVYEISIFKN